MSTEDRQIIRQVVRSYVADEYPELLEEFDVVFDSVFLTIEERLEDTTEITSLPSNSDIPFDAGLVTGTVISVACWLGIVILKAAVKDASKRDLPKLLDKVEERLATVTGKREMVHKLRERIQGILQSM